MPNGNTSGGTKVYAGAEHRNGTTGALIWSGRTKGPWWLYFFGNWDGWRTKYCESHRDAKLPESFRRGNITFPSIMTTFFLKVTRR